MTESMVSTCLQVTKLKIRLPVGVLSNRAQLLLLLTLTHPKPCLSHTLLGKQHWFHLRACGLSLPSWQGQDARGGSHGSSGRGLWSDPCTEALSNTSLARGSARTKSTALADAPVLSREIPAAATLHEGLRCLCSSAQSQLSFVLHWAWMVLALSVNSWFYPACTCNCTTKVILEAKHWFIMVLGLRWFYSSCPRKVAKS